MTDDLEQGRKDWNPQTPEGAERIFSERKYKTKVQQQSRFSFVREVFASAFGVGETQHGVFHGRMIVHGDCWKRRRCLVSDGRKVDFVYGVDADVDVYQTAIFPSTADETRKPVLCSATKRGYG